MTFLWLTVPLLCILLVHAQQYTPITDDNIYEAATKWIFDENSAREQYGNISDWDVSRVTDMAFVFERAIDFNEDISRWDVSSVTDFSFMFNDAESFNQDLSKWQTGSVEDAINMFKGATSFNGDISTWDVSKVTRMDHMFEDAIEFNQPIGNWDVSSVNSMHCMFQNATSFNKNIGSWKTASVGDISNMFRCASSFRRELCWDLSSAEHDNHVAHAFCGSPGAFDPTCVPGAPFQCPEGRRICQAETPPADPVKSSSTEVSSGHITSKPLKVILFGVLFGTATSLL